MAGWLRKQDVNLSPNRQSKYIFGNWKMSQSFEAMRSFFADSTRQNVDPGLEMAIFPSFTHLGEARKLVGPQKVYAIGAQDCSDEKNGAFTGEVSAQSLKELGVCLCLVGHSERRQRANETPQSLSKKLAVLQECGILPVFCIGESRAERESGRVDEILSSQLEVLKTYRGQLILAYEPVWAIGTGLTASASQIQETHAYILKQLGGPWPLLYGGSVKLENAQEILGIEGVHGLLIGGASLKVNVFEKICGFALESLNR
ncbi:MAG: triose-phosphate isomerase [Deltaproteobacteria bacterium CG11_big_fil_rev_8_21_14_0_20_45_16]|nr:MAG: triose-phosphate isomerase [Deltaproteobacteria bacterium CG11_big_fil_rev_8_21_14_0_20_45_16]